MHPHIYLNEAITSSGVAFLQEARKSTTALVLPAATVRMKHELRCSPAAEGPPILLTTGLSLLPRHWLRYGIDSLHFATFHPVVVAVE